MELSALLESLASQVGLPQLSLDGNGVCRLVFDAKLTLDLEPADNGATVHQLMAIFGWKTTQMAELYTQEANRRRLARDAIYTLTRTPEEHSIPSPSRSVPRTLEKPKRSQ